MHSEFLLVGIAFCVVGIGLWSIAKFWPFAGRRRAVVTAVWPVETSRLDNTPPTETVAQTPAPGVLTGRTITWPSLVDPDAEGLDEGERGHVIDALGTVGDAWCADILAKAFDEEEDETRVVIVESLGRCAGEVVAPTLERAYTSHVIAERYAAVDGASRRGYLPLLERALRDSDGTVALAAAYGLHRAKRDDLIESGLGERHDARANEIRHVLPILH